MDELKQAAGVANKWAGYFSPGVATVKAAAKGGPQLLKGDVGGLKTYVKEQVGSATTVHREAAKAGYAGFQSAVSKFTR